MLAYWLPERARYVDADGRTVELPAPGRRGVEHRSSGRASRSQRSSTTRRCSEEHDLIRTVGAAAALRLENERLDAELRARARGAARVARPDRAGGGRGAPPAGARPARRRAAAARRAGDHAAAGAPEDGRRPGAGGAHCSTRPREELATRDRGAARARARHPSGGADRPRARRGPGCARRPRAGAGRARRSCRTSGSPRRSSRRPTSSSSEALTNVAKYAAGDARPGRGRARRTAA